MTITTGLENMMGLRTAPRLSIDDIHRYWNNELHRLSGNKQYIAKDMKEIATSEVPGNAFAALSLAIQEMLKNGKYQLPDGRVGDIQNLNVYLVELVSRGTLHAYPSKTPGATSLPPEETVKLNPYNGMNKCFIDRQELGMFLVANNIALPAFWYNKDDVDLFRKAISLGKTYNLEQQLEALKREKGQLEAIVKDRLPCFDPRHDYYSPELSAAVECWLHHYWDKTKNDIAAKRSDLEEWLIENRPDVVKTPDGQINKNALDRIVSVVNPNKKGGKQAIKSRNHR